jgi:hypothetical protein
MPLPFTDPRFLLVMTYGRSGSTLLMGILNTLPGSRVTGENLNTLYFIYRAIESARLTKRKFGKFHTTPQSAWHGADEINVKSFRKNLLNAFYKDVLGKTGFETVLGFKEIGYGADSMSDKDIDGLVQFALKHIPRCTLVINTRDLNDTANSAWHAKTAAPREYLQSFENRLLGFRDKYPEQTIHVHYDDYVKDPAVLVEAFAKHGFELDITKVRDVLAVKHSFASGEKRHKPLAQRKTRLKRVLRAVRLRFSS